MFVAKGPNKALNGLNGDKPLLLSSFVVVRVL
ncbi:hypothetical protein Misp06_04332 [Microbulbifer sp. NBRC 101763]